MNHGGEWQDGGCAQGGAGVARKVAFNFCPALAGVDRMPQTGDLVVGQDDDNFVRVGRIDGNVVNPATIGPAGVP